MNVLVVNTKELNTRELFVRDVELKLLKLQQEEKEWDILIYMHQSLIYGL